MLLRRNTPRYVMGDFIRIAASALRKFTRLVPASVVPSGRSL
jgi:hypothetical protein